MLGIGKKDKEKREKIDPNKVDFEDPQLKDKVEGEDLSNKESINTNSDHPYNIQLWDVWGSTAKAAPKFGAKRFIDKGNVFLVNEKRNFKEPFPEDSLEWRENRLNVIEAEMKEKTNILDNLKKPQYSDFSEKDLRQDIKILLSFKRSLELEGKGSYMMIDSDQAGARPLFHFDRKGNYKLPVFKNVDISLMYLPTEAKITEASDLIRENDEKNSKNMVNIAAGVFLVLIVLVLFAALYMTYKSGTIDSDVVDALKNIAVNQDAITNKFSEYITELTSYNVTSVNETVVPKVNVVN